MKRIFKYRPPGITDRFTLDLSLGAKVLHVGGQDDAPTMWVLVDDEQATERREFRIFGAGHVIPEEDVPRLVYHGTWVGPVFVWHLFEVHS